MVKSLGGQICGLGFVVELDGLKGRDKLKEYGEAFFVLSGEDVGPLED